jgi:hypothetical protein
MEQGTVVEKNGKRGVVIDDLPGMLSVCSPEGVMVVWDGEDFGEEENPETLNVIGKENAICDPKKCGAGCGADCCIFMVVGPGGFSCERFTGLRMTLEMATMTAKRRPKEMFPKCYLKP